MILGFIGTGKISSSIIFGIFKSKLKIKRIYISSRNRNIAKKLSKSYGKIKVLNNNQEIIDKSSVVLLGLIIDKNFFTLLLSYCPGGIYEVAVIAIFFDLDPEFVSFHHIIRLLMILFIVPIILKFLKKT